MAPFSKQFNLKIPAQLAEKAEQFAQTWGYRNVQDLAIDSMRDKIFGRFDNDMTEEEISLIDNLIKAESKNTISEKELNKILLE